MKTKKLIAGLVSAVTLAAVTSSVIAVAADSFKVSISSTEVAAGEKFSLTMDLSDIPTNGINGCEFGISYDSTKVTIKDDDVTLGKLAKDASDAESELLQEPFKCNVEEDTINIMYALGTTAKLTGSGTFLNISGTANADASGEVKFKVVPIDRAVAPGSSTTNSEIVFGYMNDDGAEPVKYSPTFTDGILTITSNTTNPSGTTKPTNSTQASTGIIPDATRYGNVNLDVAGAVDVADLVALNLYLVNPDDNPLNDEAIANSDCMRDNVIDTLDSASLMNYVAMVTTYDSLGKKN